MISMNSTTAKPARNLWPHAIIAWFVVFASALEAWITFTVRQRTDLVRSDYYEEEVHYQRQLDRLNRTTAVRSQVAVNYDAVKGEVTVQLPAGHVVPRPTGLVRFYRPSEAALDFEVPLAVDAQGLQRIGRRNLRGGLWKMRVEWTASGQEYFFEQILVADETPTQSKVGGDLTAAPPGRD